MFEYSTLFLSLLKSNASYQENPDPAKKNKKIYIALSFSPIKNSGEVKTWRVYLREPLVSGLHTSFCPPLRRR